MRDGNGPGIERRAEIERIAEYDTPNVPLWHKDYFELIIFEKQQIQEKL